MTDLGDFGVNVQEPTPEDQVKINLARWFKNHGARVYWEKRPSYGWSVFHTDGGTNRPDLLVLGGGRTFAVEVKRGDDSASVHDGVAQIHRYWQDYTLDGQSYRADGGSLSVDAFVLATAYSPDGALFYRHGTRDTVRQRHINQRLSDYWDPPIHFLPDWEFSTTESAIRIAWRFADRSLRQHDTAGGAAGIGALLSSRLDGVRPERNRPEDAGPFERSPMPKPRALFKTFDDNGGGGAACQNWRWVS